MIETTPPPAGVRKVVTTEELLALLAQGKKVFLPPVSVPADALTQYSDADQQRLRVPAAENDIVSVKYLRDDTVQCISVADAGHLYLTDDLIPTHNTSNIVYLKSTDDSMLDTLQKMSGTRHVVYRDSKTVTKNTESIVKFNNIDSKVSYTMSVKEEPVISYNDMAFIAERNSMVIRAGDSPVWNRNETIMPMSFRLFKDTIVKPGAQFTLMTIPTLSTASEFDVLQNQPDFEKLLNKRMRQAQVAAECTEIYQTAYDYSDADMLRLDPDVASNEIMELIDGSLREGMAEELGIDNPDEVDFDEMSAAPRVVEDWEQDMELKAELAMAAAVEDRLDEKIFAGRTISKSMLVYRNGNARNGAFDVAFIELYKMLRPRMQADTTHFAAGDDGSLLSADRKRVYISKVDESASVQALNGAMSEDGMRVYAEEPTGDLSTYTIEPAFYEFLGSLDSWYDLAGGEFETMMSRTMINKAKESIMS